MTDIARPNPEFQTQLRQFVTEDQDFLPVITTAGFVPGSRKLVGDEFVLCEAFGEDAIGHPVMTGCLRGVGREDGGSEPHEWPGGTPVHEVRWTDIDILAEIPVPTRDMAGRQFQYQDESGDLYTFNVVAVQGGEPYIDWVNEPPGDEDAPRLALAPAIASVFQASGVAVDASGNVYVVRHTGTTNFHVRKYSSALALLWTSASTYTDLNGHVCTDGTHVWVTSPLGNYVAKLLCSTGAHVGFLGSAGSGDGQFDNPLGIATNGTHLWVSDRGNDRVQKFTVAGSFVSKFGSVGSGDGQFTNPAGIALDGSGNLYVIESGGARVQKFTSAHAHLLTFGAFGNADGQLISPRGIAVASDDNVWVTDGGNHRIQVFDASGVFLAKIGSFGSGASQVSFPDQIALNAEDIGYVADFGNERLSSVRVVPAGILPVVTDRSNGVTVGTNATGSVTANCNVDEVCVGGGFESSVTNNASMVVQISKRSGNGWTATLRNASGSVSTTLTAHDVCMQVPLVEDA